MITDKQKATSLLAYIQSRAEAEGVECDLDVPFFKSALRIGTRTFFGLEIGTDGEFIVDAQEPNPGHLALFKAKNRDKFPWISP